MYHHRPFWIIYFFQFCPNANPNPNYPLFWDCNMYDGEFIYGIRLDIYTNTCTHIFISIWIRTLANQPTKQANQPTNEPASQPPTHSPTKFTIPSFSIFSGFYLFFLFHIRVYTKARRIYKQELSGDENNRRAGGLFRGWVMMMTEKPL